MYAYQYLILAAFCGLYFNGRTKLAAELFLFGWAFYFVFTIELSATLYYSLTATIEAVIGFMLNKRYRLISYLNYSLILVNLFGLVLYKNGFQATSYDIIYAIISIAQVLLLIIRALGYGRDRIYFKCFMDNLVNFDSRKTRGTMYKYQATKAKET